MLRVAVIGLGPIGNLHSDIYRQIDKVELSCVCDRDRQRADAAARRLQVSAYYSVAEMLAAEKPDIVSVTTGGEEYGSDHYEPTMQALDAGCHVLVEKPICNTIPEAERMVARARERRLCFGVNLNHRFTPAMRLARQWIDEGKLGHLLFMNMAMWIKNPRESSPWFMIKALNPHSVDIMRHCCGEIEAVHCFATKAPGRSIWSTAQFNMKFACGAVGHLTASYDIERGHPMERCEVAGVGGRIIVDDMWREASYLPAGDPKKIVYTNPIFGGYRDFNDTFRCRIETFIDEVAAGTPPDQIDGSGADGLAAQKVLQAAIESITTGRVIAVNPS